MPHDIICQSGVLVLQMPEQFAPQVEAWAEVRHKVEVHRLKGCRLGAGITGGPYAAPYLAVTYSREWVEHYKEERFVEIDPAVQIGMRRVIPLDWGSSIR